MLAGEAVIATWNGITPEGRDEFYAWHIQEHIPERVGIPGFRRGRRYVAVTPDTRPEFFTLYETDTMQVLQGVDYANRLNAPTPWTKSATAHFRDTARALARVLASEGPGMGGFLLTVRFDTEAEKKPAARNLGPRGGSPAARRRRAFLRRRRCRVLGAHGGIEGPGRHPGAADLVCPDRSDRRRRALVPSPGFGAGRRRSVRAVPPRPLSPRIRPHEDGVHMSCPAGKVT